MFNLSITARKALAITSVAALSFTAVACNRGESSEGSGDSVTLALSTQTNPFFVELRDGAQAKADELGIELDIQDASDDAATQTDQLRNAETSGADVVIVNPTDSDAVGSAVQSLNNADIPVIAVDRSSNSGEVASFVASDNVAGGKQAAEALAAAIGEEGEILVLQGIAGSSASRDRGQGFEEGIAAFPNIKVVGKQTANFDRTEGLNVTTNLLQANPNIKAIFAENDEMALGAIEALGARAGEEVKVFGFDGTADGLTAVEDGKLEGTIAQQPDELGARAVEQAAAILDGETPEEEIPVEVVTVTNENVAEFK
ncbi:MAG: D-ribose ABC transporter substrate-binding protein [Corynebacterium casei]|uniref:D-ribose ABC transporter substrate-binding protein n=1 Tax=Corynebacterium casei TaxID=160386 RepID=UPI00264777F6|nr:D-ribose ABC transporter substrate-binding protein [Corynebacterium casei]MDN5800141.1 D-ribose ABC transporter substrate-binding protein [Corynebacterium casei]MDN5922483.1 D-ribose ABC transporter substrate-binding protein [Corynebacterium casei]MDN6285721.1 D-ribose ABC transporter substrate-binding protein [Corynebacterium casei]MDN6313087.1 D-ribose ABC transporter substrate-binding protein [Corynebacterium casei]MDN6341373.1 D-ribose ABC transporter substrate-binding protein [Coryneba